MRLSLNKREREIILVDDGSDLTPLNELIDLRDGIIYLRQANKGLSAARNLGLRMASGSYIQFVDGDDFLLQAPYEHCLDIMRYHPTTCVGLPVDISSAGRPWVRCGSGKGARWKTKSSRPS